MQADLVVQNEKKGIEGVINITGGSQGQAILPHLTKIHHFIHFLQLISP